MDSALSQSHWRRRLPLSLGLDPQRGETFFERVAARRQLAAAIAFSAAVVVLGSAGHRATFGLWRSWKLALYVAIKLPLLLVAPTILVMLLHWTFAQLIARRPRSSQIAA